MFLQPQLLPLGFPLGHVLGRISNQFCSHTIVGCRHVEPVFSPGNKVIQVALRDASQPPDLVGWQLAALEVITNGTNRYGHPIRHLLCAQVVHPNISIRMVPIMNPTHNVWMIRIESGTG